MGHQRHGLRGGPQGWGLCPLHGTEYAKAGGGRAGVTSYKLEASQCWVRSVVGPALHGPAQEPPLWCSPTSTGWDGACVPQRGKSEADGLRATGGDTQAKTTGLSGGNTASSQPGLGWALADVVPWVEVISRLEGDVQTLWVLPSVVWPREESWKEQLRYFMWLREPKEKGSSNHRTNEEPARPSPPSQGHWDAQGDV